MATQQAIVDEARSWISTPFRWQGALKGVAVDCLMILVRVFQAVGLAPTDLDPRPYPRGWCLRDNRYLERIGMEGMVPVEPPYQPGDVALFKIGRAPAHAAIVTNWPYLVHADEERGVIECAARETGKPLVVVMRHRSFIEG